jgi:acyl-CoA thioester hydrolase
MAAMEQQPSSATITRRVEWSDTDPSGHHHNTLIIRLAEAAERELMDAAGLTDSHFSGAPRVRHEIDYTAPLRFGQEVTATITVERLGRASVTYSFEVWGEEFRGRPRARAAYGTIVAAHVAAGAHRASPWPDAVGAVLIPRTPRNT